MNRPKNWMGAVLEKVDAFWKPIMHSVLIKETQCSGEEEDSIVIGRSSGRQSCHHLINSHTSDSSPLLFYDLNSQPLIGVT